MQCLNTLRLAAKFCLVGFLWLLPHQGWANTNEAKSIDIHVLPKPFPAQLSTVSSRLIETSNKLRIELRTQQTSSRQVARQALELQMSLRGRELLAQHLCRFTPVPGKRLETILRGVQVVHSSEQEGWMELTLEVPIQTVNCEIKAVAVRVSRVEPLDTKVSNVPNPGALTASPSESSFIASESAKPIAVQRSIGEF